MGAAVMALIWLWSSVWMPWAASLRRARPMPHLAASLPHQAAAERDEPIMSRMLVPRPPHDRAELAGMESAPRSAIHSAMIWKVYEEAVRLAEAPKPAE
jgi:hypothetical protein